MIVIRIIHNITFYILLIISYIIGTLLAWVFSLFTKDKTKPFKIAAKIWSNFLAITGGMRVKCNGLKNIPKKQGVILVSNHQGAVDIPLLLAKLPLLFVFMVKRELFKIPFFGWFLRKAGHLSVDRGKASSAFSTLNQAQKMLASGESIVIFPEGTRSRDGSLGPFKRGSLLLAIKSKVPVIPIAIDGSFKARKKGSFLFYPTTITLSIGEPIHITHKENPNKEDQERELYRVRDAIIELLED